MHDASSNDDLNRKAVHVHEHVHDNDHVDDNVDVVVLVLVNVDGLLFNSLPFLSSLGAPTPRRQRF